MLRFAVDSDELTLGGLKVALLTQQKAKELGEKFILRLKYPNTNIEESLGLFGLRFDDIVYKSQNLRFHQHLTSTLLMQRKAFNCFCESKDRDESCQGGCQNLPDDQVIDNENPFCVRIKYHDSDFKILHVDKTPTDIFATAVDDMLSDITTIMIEQKYIKNIEKENFIREQLGYSQKIEYIQLPDFPTTTIKELLDSGLSHDEILEKIKDIESK